LNNVKENTQFKEFKTLNKKSASTNNEVDVIEKKRALKRWKQSFSYYCLHPDKFRFGIKDLK